MKQIQSFSGELKHSGTIDFVLSDAKGTVVLSLQEQYLSKEARISAIFFLTSENIWRKSAHVD